MIKKSLKVAGRIGVTVIFLFATLGCRMLSLPTPVTPTATPSATASRTGTISPTATATSTPSPTATSCQPGPYTWAYGTVPPEFVTRIHNAITAAGLEGSAQASTFGENNGTCGYSPMSVDYVFILQVGSLEAGAELASSAGSVLEIITNLKAVSPAPNLGNLSLIFQADGLQCAWFYRDGAWRAGSAGADNMVVCPAPVSADTQKLADVLTVLAVDLACDTYAVSADTQQAALECDWPQGEERYILTVTFRLEGQGYTDACFHGYPAHESSATGDDPMTVTDDSGMYFERNRNFEWMANGILFSIFERMQGGADVTLPLGTREQVYLRALQMGLIPGAGDECP